MHFIALAVDYDGTLADTGRVDAEAVEALHKLRRSGRKLVLVTGRLLPDLEQVFPELGTFDLVVAENGGLLFDPATGEVTALADPAPPALVEALAARGVEPLSVGHVIIGTWQPHEHAVLAALRDLGLEHRITFNKGAVMVLPSAVSKATGLAAAATRLRLSLRNVVGIGDAENDLAMLESCGCAVAVANALPSVKAIADFEVAARSAGVRELIDRLVRDDLRSLEPRMAWQHPVLGQGDAGTAIPLRPFETLLVTGASGGGKSTTVTALLEQMHALALQFCVVDPEGDYAGLEDAIVIGDAKQEPLLAEVIDLLARPDVSVVVNLLAIPASERPAFLAELLPELMKFRASSGRPHWLVLDECHHCLPADWQPATLTLPDELTGTIGVTVHPESVSTAFLKQVSMVLGVGEGAGDAIRRFAGAIGRPLPGAPLPAVKDGGLLWRGDGSIVPLALGRPKQHRKRHRRKYAEGALGEDKSFWFRGPRGALKLRAQNLTVFVQIAEGVDDETWLHHLRAGEYSRWLREAVKDEELAVAAEVVEQDGTLAADQSRQAIREMIEKKYTAPATKS